MDSLACCSVGRFKNIDTKKNFGVACCSPVTYDRNSSSMLLVLLSLLLSLACSSFVELGLPQLLLPNIHCFCRYQPGDSDAGEWSSSLYFFVPQTGAGADIAGGLSEGGISGEEAFVDEGWGPDAVKVRFAANFESVY